MIFQKIEKITPQISPKIPQEWSFFYFKLNNIYMFIQIYRIWKRKRGRDANLRSLPDRTVRVITYKHKKQKKKNRGEKT